MKKTRNFFGLLPITIVGGEKKEAIMISGGENKIPKGCYVGAEYYGGMGMDSTTKGREKAQSCAASLTLATKKPHDVMLRVENAGAGDGIYLQERWYKVIQGTSRK